MTEDWKVEMLNYTSNKKDIQLLTEGPKSWMEAMRLGALKSKYNKIMGVVEKDPPNCQSSFKEWNENL